MLAKRLNNAYKSIFNNEYLNKKSFSDDRLKTSWFYYYIYWSLQINRIEIMGLFILSAFTSYSNYGLQFFLSIKITHLILNRVYF